MIQVITLKLHYNGEFLRLPGDIYMLDSEAADSHAAVGIIQIVQAPAVAVAPPAEDTPIDLV